MAKDPAFLFYSQDFYTGVATLNWEERGKFISILCLMHQQGRMNEETIRFLVGSVSDNLKSKFSIDEKGLWFNKRLEEEAAKRNNFTESRRLNGLSGGRPKKQKPNAKPNQKHKVNHTDKRMEDENDNEIVNEYIKWTDKILDNNDHQFETLLFNERWIIDTNLFEHLVRDHLGLLHRYPNMRPKDQGAFRYSLLKHIRENKDKQQQNGTSKDKREQHVNSLKENFAKRVINRDKPE